MSPWFRLSRNGLLTLMFLADGSLLPALLRHAVYRSVVGAGIVLAEILPYCIAERLFRSLVFGLPVVTGAVLAV